MDCIVLAGGLGTRLRSVVPDLPKPMAPIGGRPFLDILISSLRSKGITRVVLSLGYKSDAVTDYFTQHRPGVELEYAVEQIPLGTGGAIKAALSRCRSEFAFVCNGDTFLEMDFREVAGMWSLEHTPVVVTREVQDTSRFGRVEIENQRIVRFSGTGIAGMGRINAGCYLLPSNALDNFPEGKFSFETEYLARQPAGYLRSFLAQGLFIDIGVPDDYARAQLLISNL